MRPFAAYDGVDPNRTVELTGKVNEYLVRSCAAAGFKGYYLIEAGDGVFSSLGLFETREQGEESSKLVRSWIHDEKLETLMPNEPKITSGKIVAQSNGSRSRNGSHRRGRRRAFAGAQPRRARAVRAPRRG